MNATRVAEALRALAAAIETPAETADLPPPQPTAAPAAAPAKRGRGRPVQGEVAPAPAGQPPAASVGGEPDPFATAPAAPAVPTATLEEVKAALTALRQATDQNNALAVLTAAGGKVPIIDTEPSKYGAIVAAAKAAMPQTAAAEADLFADPAPAAPAEKPLSKEDLKALCLETGKRTAQDKVLKVIFDHGGKGPAPGGNGEVASFHALPESQYAAVAAALKALPTTK